METPIEKFAITFVGAFIAFVIWDVVKSVARRRSSDKREA